jgi:hypothetical protein
MEIDTEVTRYFRKYNYSIDTEVRKYRRYLRTFAKVRVLPEVLPVKKYSYTGTTCTVGIRGFFWIFIPGSCIFYCVWLWTEVLSYCMYYVAMYFRKYESTFERLILPYLHRILEG